MSRPRPADSHARETAPPGHGTGRDGVGGVFPPDSLAGGLFDRVRKNPWTVHTAVIATAGILLAFFLIRQSGDLRRLPDIVRQSGTHLIGFFVLTNVYLLCKGLALRQAARCTGVRLSLPRAVRVFCESSTVGLVTAKIASDIYKYTRVGSAPRAARIRTVLIYRVAAILAVLILTALVSLLWAETADIGSKLTWLVPVVVIGGLVLGYRSRVSVWCRAHGRYLLAVLPYSILALAAKIAGLSILLGVSLDGQLVEVAAAFLVIGSLASMAQVPSGLGMLDAGYAIYLTKIAGVGGAETALILIALRLLGPLYVAALGAISIALHYVRRRVRSIETA